MIFLLLPEVSASPPPSIDAAEIPSGFESCGVSPQDAIAWLEPGVLLVKGNPGESYALHGYVRLGELSYRWSEPRVQLPEGGEVVVPLRIPEEAFLHEAAFDYVTDLLVQVDLGKRRQSATLAHLVWSHPAVPPMVIGQDELATVAPNGVIRDEVRRDLPPGVRQMPDVGRVRTLPLRGSDRNPTDARVVPERGAGLEDTGDAQ
ncbi:MAG: hypothetical protein H6736_03550 [Alphaproteobacteria bacterium]|nr:hypothetical protein [Alphaproteobacteria bacterium]MCB9690869.1 hypothetical protein [Alphaproteobacteria bacterium]